MQRAGILFSDFGPYHVARIEALGRSLREAGRELVAFRFTERSDTYGWEPVLPAGVETVTLADRYPAGAAEAARMAWCFRSELRQRGITAAFLPTYSPLPNLLCLLAAKSAGCRAILMTESWLGTENAGMVGRVAKHVLVRMFDSALVGGTPQRDFVVAYGMPPDKVFTGYDVVDVDHFAKRSEEVRGMLAATEVSSGLSVGRCCDLSPSASADSGSVLASADSVLGLPPRFFLNLGRFVEKKNLSTLVAAYSRYCDEWREPESAQIGRRGDQPGGEKEGRAPVALVLVGEGPLRADLESQARELDLLVVDRGDSSSVTRHSSPVTRHQENGGAIFFYPFQQSDMTPVFFALCEAFVLPSTREEWGLVVNEAMACGAPVIASNRVGAGFDLVKEDVTGFRFNPDDGEALTGLLARFDSDPHLRERLGQAGARVIKDWGPERFGREGLKALEAAAAAGAHS